MEHRCELAKSPFSPYTLKQLPARRDPPPFNANICIDLTFTSGLCFGYSANVIYSATTNTFTSPGPLMPLMCDILMYMYRTTQEPRYSTVTTNMARP